MPDVSVITRTYNSAETIERALDSLDDQSLEITRYECVVVDDASSDNTVEIVNEYATEHPYIVRPFTHAHMGPVASLNAGIERASGDYVTVLDADDYFCPLFLERTTAILDADPETAFVYTDYYEKTIDGERRYIDTGDDLFSTITIGILFRKDALSMIGFYDESMLFSEYDLLMKLVRNGYTGEHIDEPLFVYDRRDDSLTADQARVENGKRELRERYGEDFSVREY